MTQSSATRSLAIAAIVAACAGPVSAQFRVGQDGRLMDASPQVGSGGYNAGVVRGIPPDLVNGRSTQNNNTLGGGNRYGTATNPLGTGVQSNSGTMRYSDPSSARAAPTSGGMARFSRDTGYTSNLPPIQIPDNDTRLGLVGVGPQTRLPRVGQTNLPGPVDPTGVVPPLAASPVFGARPLQPPDPSIGMSSVNPVYGAMQRLQISHSDLVQMRSELNATPEATAQQNRSGPPGEGDQADGESPAGFVSSSVSAPSLTSSEMNNTLTSDQSVRSRLIVPASEQSAQYAEMARRYGEADSGGTDAQANLALLEQMRARDAARQNKAGEMSVDPNLPYNPADPASAPEPAIVEPTEDSVAGTVRPQSPNDIGTGLVAPSTELPVVVSLAAGMEAEGLAKLITGAENSMREGRFADAIDRFDVAAGVAANDPLIALGRTFAELGASYYRPAASNLRQLLTANPPLLMARYDLRTLFGDQRHEFLMSDLKSIANSESENPDPVFLLGYMAFNGGDRDRATVWLNEADRRAGGDPTIRLMLRVWSLAGGK